jgi:RNA polymerase sigma-70 factor (ECF subfamily)
MGIAVSHPVLFSIPTPGDAELVARAIAGDRWSREMIYRRHANYLLGMTVRLMANRSEAEEVVQDTFIAGFEQLQTLRNPEALRAWLSQIAVSLVRRRMRRARLLRFLGLDRGADDATLESLAASGVDPEGSAELALLDQVLRGMRTELRIAWMLRRVDGLELTEVASVCRCSLATAKRRIVEAEAIVQRHLNPNSNLNKDQP